MIHLDDKTTFINGIIQENVYILQHEGFIVLGKETLVYKMNKALYGLKQSARCWYIDIDGIIYKGPLCGFNTLLENGR